jgi:hypothetical protein
MVQRNGFIPVEQKKTPSQPHLLHEIFARASEIRPAKVE